MEKIKSDLVIDISSYQGIVDWDLVKKSGVRDVIIRSTVKSGELDSCFYTNFHSARGLGYKPMVYKFMYSKDAGTAYDEFYDTILKVKKATGDNHPFIWCDVENINRVRFTTNEALRAIMGAHMAAITLEADFGIYCNLDYLVNVIPHCYDSNHLDIPIWLARYNDHMGDFPNWNIVLWQYTKKGKLPGITGDVDFSEWV